VTLQVAIVGGGIGGLAAGLFLLEANINVTIYEQASALNEVGAGIVVPPNMVRPLHKLGIAGQLAEFAVRLEHSWEFRRWQDGAVIAATPMQDAERLYGAPCYVAHRADLRAFLHRALPRGILRLGHRCVAVQQTQGEVELYFRTPSGAETRVRPDVVVGADGIHSLIRDAIVPKNEPRFSGLCAFRCLVPAQSAPEMARRPVQTLWLGPGRHFVHYPVSSGLLINIVAMAPAGEWRTESWTEDGRISDLLREFETWDERVHQLILSATETKRWALYDRAPLETWTRGRITLLGDAAHAMLPFLAQGAAQAIEDAAALGESLRLADRTSVEAALTRYEAMRRPRANSILLGSRGREIRNHLPDGQEQRRRDAELAVGDPLRQSAWLYGQ
jgi:salicylate hydroxylase